MLGLLAVGQPTRASIVEHGSAQFNQAVQRTGASRLAQRQTARHRRLAPGAGVRPRRAFMKSDERQRREEKVRGFRPSFFKWCLTANFTRSDPRIMLFLAIWAVALMIFGGSRGLMLGSLLLWWLATILVPAIWAESLCRRFGSKWGMIIALAPLWVPVVLALSARLWMPMFRIH